MLVNRVQAEFIGTNRIDPDYYRPEHLADEKHLRELGSDELGTVGDFFAGPFGSKLPSDLYLSAGIPLFRVGNVGSMEVLLDGMAHLAPEVHEELSDSEVIPGDLLIVKASVGEKICRVPSWMPRANITQHIIGIRPNGHVDMDYVAAFLFCQYGRRQLVRRSLGSIIQYLGITDSKNVLFPRIKSTAQKYIGEKVRQAEQLRQHASRVRRNLQQVANHGTGDETTDQEKNICHRANHALLAHRLDPKYYEPHILSMERRIREAGSVTIGELKPSVTNGFEWRRFVDVGTPFVTVSEVSSGRLDLSNAPLIPAELGVPDKASVNERCLLVVRSGSVGCAVKAHREDSHAALSSDIIRVEFPGESTTAAVAAFLGTSSGIALLLRAAYGTVMPKLAQEELLLVPIPTRVLELGTEICEMVNSAEASTRCVQRLIIAAKLLVEALIEGKVTEAEFVAAQETLERGDDSADRALLRRLTRHGLDIPGQPPLFPDLDALYTLLARTQEANP